MAVYFDIQSYYPVDIVEATKFITVTFFFPCRDIKNNIKFYKNIDNTFSGLIEIPIEKVDGDNRSSVNNGVTLHFAIPLSAGEYLAIVDFYNDLSYPLQKQGYDSLLIYESQIALIMHMLGLLHNNFQYAISVDNIDWSSKPLTWESGSLLQWNDNPDDKYLQNITIEALNKLLKVVLCQDFTDKNLIDIGDDEWVIVRDKNGVKVSGIKIIDLEAAVEWVNYLHNLFVSNIGSAGDVLTLDNRLLPHWAQPAEGGVGGYDLVLCFPEQIDDMLPYEEIDNYKPRKAFYSYSLTGDEFYEGIYLNCCKNVPEDSTVLNTIIDIYGLEHIPDGKFISVYINNFNDGIDGTLNDRPFLFRFFAGSDDNSFNVFTMPMVLFNIGFAKVYLTLSNEKLILLDHSAVEEIKPGMGFPLYVNAGYDLSKRGYQNINIPLNIRGKVIINFSIPNISEASLLMTDPSGLEREDCVYLNLVFADESYLYNNLEIDIIFDFGLNDNLYKAVEIRSQNENKKIFFHLLASAGVANDNLNPKTVISKGKIELFRSTRGVWIGNVYADPRELTQSMEKEYLSLFQLLSNLVLDLKLVFPRHIYSNRFVQNPSYIKGKYGSGGKNNSIPFNQNERESACIVRFDIKNADSENSFITDSNFARYSNISSQPFVWKENKAGLSQNNKIINHKRFLICINADMVDSHFVGGLAIKNSDSGTILAIFVSGLASGVYNHTCFFSINLQTLSYGDIGGVNGLIRLYNDDGTMSTVDVSTPFLFEKKFKFTNVGATTVTNHLIEFGVILNTTTAKELSFGELNLNRYISSITNEALAILEQQFLTMIGEIVTDLQLQIVDGDKNTLIASNNYSDGLLENLRSFYRYPTNPVPIWGYRTELFTPIKKNVVWMETYTTVGIINRQIRFQINTREIVNWNDGEVFLLQITIVVKTNDKLGSGNGSFIIINETNGTILSEVTIRDNANGLPAGITGTVLLQNNAGVAVVKALMFGTVVSDGNSGTGTGTGDLSLYLTKAEAATIYLAILNGWDRIQSDARYLQKIDFQNFEVNNTAAIENSLLSANNYTDDAVNSLDLAVQQILTLISTLQEQASGGMDVYFPAMINGFDYKDPANFAEREFSYEFDFAVNRVSSIVLVLMGKNTGDSTITDIYIKNCQTLGVDVIGEVLIIQNDDPNNIHQSLNTCFIVHFLADDNIANELFGSPISWSGDSSAKSLKEIKTLISITNEKIFVVEGSGISSSGGVSSSSNMVVDGMVVRDWEYDDVLRNDSWLQKSSFTASELSFIKSSPPRVTFYPVIKQDLIVKNLELKCVKWFEYYYANSLNSIYEIKLQNSIGININPTMLNNDFIKFEWQNIKISTGPYGSSEGYSNYAIAKAGNSWNGGVKIWLGGVGDVKMIAKLPIVYENKIPIVDRSTTVFASGNFCFINGNGQWYYGLGKIKNIVPASQNQINGATISLTDDMNGKIICISAISGFLTGATRFKTEPYYSTNRDHGKITVNNTGLTKKINIILRYMYCGFTKMSMKIRTLPIGFIEENVVCRINLYLQGGVNSIKTYVPVFSEESDNIQILDIPVAVDNVGLDVLSGNPFEIIYNGGDELVLSEIKQQVNTNSSNINKLDEKINNINNTTLSYLGSRFNCCTPEMINDYGFDPSQYRIKSSTIKSEWIDIVLNPSETNLYIDISTVEFINAGGDNVIRPAYFYDKRSHLSNPAGINFVIDLADGELLEEEINIDLYIGNDLFGANLPPNLNEYDTVSEECEFLCNGKKETSNRNLSLLMGCIFSDNNMSHGLIGYMLIRLRIEKNGGITLINVFADVEMMSRLIKRSIEWSGTYHLENRLVGLICDASLGNNAFANIIDLVKNDNKVRLAVYRASDSEIDYEENGIQLIDKTISMIGDQSNGYELVLGLGYIDYYANDLANSIVDNPFVHNDSQYILIEEKMRDTTITIDTMSDNTRTTNAKDRKRYIVLSLYQNEMSGGTVNPDNGDFNITLIFRNVGGLSEIRKYTFFVGNDSISSNAFYKNPEIIICVSPYYCVTNQTAILWDSFDQYRLKSLEERINVMERLLGE